MAGESHNIANRGRARPASRQPRVRVSSLRRLVILATLVFLFAWILSAPDITQLSLLEDGQPKTALILTAHPDDEVMFFTPTILGLIASGWEVSALCLSTGNGDGLGNVRTEELYRAYQRLGVPPQRVVLVDDPYLQDGMQNHWSSSYVSKLLDRYLSTYPATIIITFDLRGITHHPNHIALAHGCSFGPSNTSRRCFALESPHILTKFTGPLFTIIRNLRNRVHSALNCQARGRKGLKQRVTVTNDVAGRVSGAKAMAEHWSQLVWFRYLYFAFSRLVWDNTLEELLEHG